MKTHSDLQPRVSLIAQGSVKIKRRMITTKIVVETDGETIIKHLSLTVIVETVKKSSRPQTEPRSIAH